MMPVENSILLSYAITIVSETAIILSLWRPPMFWRWTAAILLINSLTQPIAVYFILIQNAPYALVEGGVFIAEALWYRLALPAGWRRSLVISATANLFSIFAGALLRFLFRL